MRAALDLYDELPKAMRKYLMHNGWHFNKSLCYFATSLMKKHGKKLVEKKEQKTKIITWIMSLLLMKEFNNFYKSIPEDIWKKENERW